jgi:hypothetical protein
MILGFRTPISPDKDRKRMRDNNEALAARDDWNLDPGSACHRRIKKKPSPCCPVPTEDAKKHFTSFWRANICPQNTYIPPKKDSACFMQPPMENTLNLEGNFAE